MHGWLEKYNNVSNGVQHVILFIGVVFAAGVTYSVMSADIIELQAAKVEIGDDIKNINKKINIIKIEQAVAATQFKNLEKEQREFRKRTDRGLEKILDRLNGR